MQYQSQRQNQYSAYYNAHNIPPHDSALCPGEDAVEVVCPRHHAVGQPELVSDEAGDGGDRDAAAGANVMIGTLSDLMGHCEIGEFTRIYNNVHCASDAVVGAAIGSFVGWKVVRYTHANPENRVDRWLLGVTIAPPDSSKIEDRNEEVEKAFENPDFDVRDIDLTQVLYASGPIAVAGARPLDRDTGTSGGRAWGRHRGFPFREAG